MVRSAWAHGSSLKTAPKLHRNDIFQRGAGAIDDCKVQTWCDARGAAFARRGACPRSDPPPFLH